MMKSSSFSTRFAYCIGFTALALVSATALSKTVWSSGTSSSRRTRKKRERPQLPVSRTIPNSFRPDKYYTKGLSYRLREMLPPGKLPSSNEEKQSAGFALPYIEDGYTSDDMMTPTNSLPLDKGKQRAGPSRPMCSPSCEDCAYFSDARHNYTADLESEQDDGFLAQRGILTYAGYPPGPLCTCYNNTDDLGPLVPPGIPIPTDSTRQTVFPNTWNVLLPSGASPPYTTNNAYASGSSDIHTFNPFGPTTKQDSGYSSPYSAPLLTPIYTDNPNVPDLKAPSSSREFQMALAGVTITPCEDTLQVTIGMGGRNKEFLADIRKICLESTVFGNPLRVNITLQYGMWDMAEGYTVIRSIIGTARCFASSITATAPYEGSSCTPISTSIGPLPFRTSVWANDTIRPSLNEIYFSKLVSLTLDCSISIYDCLEVIYRARNLIELEVLSLRRCDSIMEHTYLQFNSPQQDIVSQVSMLSIVSFEDLTPLFQRVRFPKLTDLALIIKSSLWPRDLRVPWPGLLKVDLIGNLDGEISLRIREACSDKTQHHHAMLDGLVVWHNTVYDGSILGPQRVINKTIHH